MLFSISVSLDVFRRSGSYLMFLLMCAGLLEWDLFLVPLRDCEGIWFSGREDGRVGGWVEGGDGVSPEAEVDGGVHCHPAESPPCASFPELKGEV